MSCSYITLLILMLCLSLPACKCSSRKIYSNHQVVKNTVKLGDEKPEAFLVKNQAASKSATDSGDDHIIIAFKNDLQRLAKLQAFAATQERSQADLARSLLGSSSPDDTGEAVDSKGNDFVEDTVVMDYAQPHRKPPIHNEKS